MQCNQEFSPSYNSSLNILELYFKVPHPKVQCNHSFLFATIALIFNIPRLHFKVAHPKVQCNQSFLFDTVAIFNIPRLYFKVALQKVQCTPIFLFYMMKNLISLLYILYETLLLTGSIINLSWHTLKEG